MKKRFLISLVLALLLLAVFAIPSHAASSDFVINDKGVLTAYNGTSTTVTVPSTVKRIYESAFKGNKRIQSISIPSSVTTIDDRAFDGCTGLQSVFLPNSIQMIGTCTFRDCTGIQTIYIPGSVQSIGIQAFSGCTGLRTVVLESGLTIIDGFAFHDCANLSSISLPNGLEKIGNEAFYGCSSLTTISIPSSVTSIGDSFEKCSGLISVTIGGGTIGSYAFDGCTSLTNLTICSGVGSIGKYAFRSCSSLSDVSIPGSVGTINDSAFTGCKSLKTVTIESGVSAINGYAFSGCTALSSVTFGGNVSLGQGAFYNCPNLSSLRFPYGSSQIYRETFYNCGLQSVSIPSSVSVINSTAFKNCSKLQSVSIPTSVTSIGNEAFRATSLSSVTIPNSVTSIGDSVFSDNSNLTSAFIPSSVTTIGYRIFSGCPNVHVTVYENSYAETYCINNGYPYTAIVEPPVVYSASFNSDAHVGKSVSITVKTPAKATSVTLFAENGGKVKTWTNGYTDSGDLRTWNLSYTFSNSGDRSLSFKASADGTNYGNSYPISIHVTSVPKVTSAAFASGVTVGYPASLTVTTSTDAKYISLCSENGSIVKTWSSGYTDSGSTRTWKVSYTFSGAGSRKLSIKASADNKTYSNAFAVNLTVSSVVVSLPTVTSAAFSGTAVVSTPITATVKTSIDAKYLTMCSEGKGTVKTWTSGYTDSGSVRTWNISYSFSGAGKRSLYFKASADGKTYGSYSAAVPVTVVPALKSASFTSSAISANDTANITVVTDTAAKYIRMYAENGSTAKTWSSGYSDSGSTRTWKLTYKFAGAGTRTLTFKASTDNSIYGPGKTASITIGTTEPPTINSAFFSSSSVTVGKATSLAVVTSSNATSVSMYSESKALVKTWTTGYIDSGNYRIWSLSYTFGGAGNRSLYFRASNGTSYSDYINARVTVNTAVTLEIYSASFSGSTTVGKAVSATVVTSTKATSITMCHEGKSAVKTWTSGYTDNGTKRTWYISYTFSGAGNRTLYFKASDGANSVGYVSASVSVANTAKLTSASFNTNAVVGNPVSITVVTNTATKYVTMYSEGGGAVKTWSSGYTDNGTTRTWNITYTFGGAGNRSLTFRPSTDGSTYASGAIATVTVYK